MAGRIKHIMVTGGTGFLGRHIVTEGKSAGYIVHAPSHKDVDIETGEGLKEWFKNRRKDGTPINAVIHSAAYYGGLGFLETDPFGIATRNIRMAVNVFETAVRAGVKKFVSVGSSCSYPEKITGEMYEEDIFQGRCHESVEAYGFSKRVHLVLMAAARRQYDMECVQIALTNLYGEHDVFGEARSHAISALIKKVADAHQSGGRVKAWGTGTPMRQFVYVRDAAKVIVRAITFPGDDWPVNVGGEEVSVRDLTHTITDHINLPRDRIDWDTSQPDGVHRKAVSDEKLRRLWPEYRPVPFHEGLKKTIQWYLANKESADLRP
ncbi:MAG: NAD-dependent epimerase/dehydratase family protein [Parvularculales bacterium]